MKIVNIDAEPLLAQRVFEAIPFALNVVESNRKKKNDKYGGQNIFDVIPPHEKELIARYPVRTFSEDSYKNVYNLVHTIPIYLRKMRPEVHSKTDIIDPLGAYFPNRKNKSPYIELYPSKIADTTNGYNRHFKWLFTKVLIHELAHAALDNYNQEGFSGKEKLGYDDFRKWREESMANAIALRIIKECGNGKFYNYAESFVKRQKPEYALGALMVGFDSWDFRSVMRNKENGVEKSQKKEWLDYVKNTPDWTGLKDWNRKLANKK